MTQGQQKTSLNPEPKDANRETIDNGRGALLEKPTADIAAPKNDSNLQHLDQKVVSEPKEKPDMTLQFLRMKQKKALLLKRVMTSESR